MKMKITNCKVCMFALFTSSMLLAACAEDQRSETTPDQDTGLLSDAFTTASDDDAASGDVGTSDDAASGDVGTGGDAASGDVGTGDDAASGDATCEPWVPSRDVVVTPYANEFMDLKDEIKSFEFTTRSGWQSVKASYSSTNPVIKTVWVSECPGGTPIADAMFDDGYQTAIVWYNGGSTESADSLILGEVYYFNVMNAVKTEPSKSTCEAFNCIFIPKIH